MEVTITNQLSDPVRAFLLDVAVREKHWPATEAHALLERDALFVSVGNDQRVVGAAQVLFEPPYPVENLFPGCIARDGRRPCEVTLTAVDHEHRRSSADCGARILDALIKSIYLCCRGRGVTHVYALFDERAVASFERHVGLALAKVSDGAHHRCGTYTHGPACTLTFACALDIQASERRWQTERPKFWAYLRG